VEFEKVSQCCKVLCKKPRIPPKSVSIDHLETGRRAIAIKTKGQWGFIQAGSRVDVIYISQRRSEEEDQDAIRDDSGSEQWSDKSQRGEQLVR